MNSTASSSSSLIPVTLLTGFLGSGKTTLLNQLVRQPAMSDALVIINEFGAISLDHLLVSHVNEDFVVQMDSGCVCCTVRGDLKKTLLEAVWRYAREGKRNFSRVVIETTGLADPVPILHTLMTDDFLSAKYAFDGVITVIDGVNGLNTLDNHPEAIKQAAVADKLLLTKSDIADAEQLAALQARLHAINPSAEQLTVLNGQIDAAELLDLGLFALERKSSQVEAWLKAEAFVENKASAPMFKPVKTAGAFQKTVSASVEAVDVNRHDDHIRAFCFTVDEPVDPFLFDEWVSLLMGLMGEDILRVKGLINLEGYPGPMVIHGVQHVFHPPFELAEWPSDDKRTRLVFITKDIERELIERTFNAVAQGRMKLA